MSSYRSAVGCVEIVIETVEAAAVTIARRVSKLRIVESTIGVVAQHHIGPSESQHRNISQIDNISVVAIDVIAHREEVVERRVVVAAERESENGVDAGGSVVDYEPGGHNRSGDDSDCGTVLPYGRRQRTAPVVVAVVVVIGAVVAVVGQFVV